MCGAGKAKSLLARHEINRLLESKGVHKNHSNVGWKLGLGLRIIKLPTVQLRTFSYFHNSFRCKCCPHNFVLDYPQSCPLVVTDSYKCKRRNYSFVNLQTGRQTDRKLHYIWRSEETRLGTYHFSAYKNSAFGFQLTKHIFAHTCKRQKIYFTLTYKRLHIKYK